MADEQQTQMVNINGKQYDFASLSDVAKAQLANIRYADREIEQAKNQLAMLQAARQYYAGVLTKELPDA